MVTLSVASNWASESRGNLSFWSVRSLRFPLMNDVTRLLHAAGTGDGASTGQLLALVYEELRKLAAVKMAHEPHGHTLQPTALVHEAWMRLVGPDGDAHFANRAHFFSAAAEAMRRILIEDRAAQTRGTPRRRARAA